MTTPSIGEGRRQSALQSVIRTAVNCFFFLVQQIQQGKMHGPLIHVYFRNTCLMMRKNVTRMMTLQQLMISFMCGAQKNRKKGELLPKSVTTSAKLTNALDKIMDAVTSDTLSSVGNSGAVSRSTIRDCLEIMKNTDGLVVGDPLYLFGAHLFKRAVDRKMIVELPAEAHLVWLKSEQSVFFRR